MEMIPAVVTPLDYHMGVDIARSLGRRGVPVYGIDADPHTPGRGCKYARLAVCPDPQKSKEAFVQFLADFGRNLGRKAVLYGVRDEEVVIISEARNVLSEYYHVIMPPHATLVKLMAKDGLAEAAAECGIAAPKTIRPASTEHLAEVARDMEFPVIIKPIESCSWRRPEIATLLDSGALAGRPKVVQCRTREELLDRHRSLARLDDRLVVQEVIPGEDERLVYFASYANRQSQVIASFAGRKLRVIPVGFGSASYVKTIHDPELRAIAIKLLCGVKYQGLSGIEFKLDPRDSTYKLVEVNVRFGLWDGLSTAIGVDLPHVAYLDAIGETVEPRHEYPSGVIWVDYYRDVSALIAYHHLGRLTASEWIRSLRGKKMVATYASDDWKPLFLTGMNLASRFVREGILRAK